MVGVLEGIRMSVREHSLEAELKDEMRKAYDRCCRTSGPRMRLGQDE